MFIFINKVNAETFYSDYYEVESIVGLNEDEFKINTYKLYNKYKIEYENLGYIEDKSEYIKNENDYIYKDIVTDKTSGDEYITVYLNDIEQYKNSIKFGTVNKSKFYEVEIYNGDEKIKYETNDLENISYMFDNNFETYYKHNNILQYIMFKFLNKYNLEDIKFVIYTKESLGNTSFLLYTEPRIKIELNNNIDRKHIISFKIDYENVGRVDYIYKDKVKLYKYYKENKIILNEYVKDEENIILDDFKIVNEYFKRDKLVLKDDLIIDNTNIKLDDFIEYSNGEIKIDCDIDYNKNGIYKCNFLINNLNIEKNIVVDIPIKKDDKVSEILNEESSNSNEVFNEEIEAEKLLMNENNTVKENNITKKNTIKHINKKIKKNSINEKNIKLDNKVLENNNKKILSYKNNIVEQKDTKRISLKFYMIIILFILSIIKIIRIYCRKYLKNNKNKLY